MPKAVEPDEVGKRPKVAISMGWWSEAWPSDTPPKNHDTVKRAITRYKRTKGGPSKGDFIKAVENLLAAFDIVLLDAKRQLRNHPIKKKALLRDLEKAAKIIAKEADVALKSGDAMTQLYRISFGDAVQAEIDKVQGLDRLSFSGHDIEVSVPEIVLGELEATNSHQMLIGSIEQAVKARVKEAVAGITSAAMKHGKYNKALRADVDRNFKIAFSALQTEVAKLPVKVIARTINNKAIAKKYKIAKAVKIGKAGGGVAVGVAGMALPGTTALAVVGLARSMLALAAEIQSITTHVETKIQNLVTDIELLLEKYEKHSKSKEIAGEALNALMGVPVRATAATAKADFADIKKNVAQIWHRSTKKGKKLAEAKKKCLELGLQMEAIRTSSKASLKEMKDFDALVAGFDKLSKQQEALIDRVTAAERILPLLKRGIAGLDAVRDESADQAAKVLSGVITILWNLGGITDAAGIAKSMESTINGCIGAADDIISLSREVASA